MIRPLTLALLLLLVPHLLLAQGLLPSTIEYLDDIATDPPDDWDIEPEYERLQLAFEDSLLAERSSAVFPLHGIIALRTGQDDLQRASLVYGSHLRFGFSRGVSAELRNIGFLDRLVIGDYHQRSGFGLTLWTGGMRPFTSRDPIENVSNIGSGSTGYSGTRPASAFRGASIRILPGYHTSATLFASRRAGNESAGMSFEYRMKRIYAGLIGVAQTDSIDRGVRAGAFIQARAGPLTGFGEGSLPDQRIFAGFQIRTLDLGEVIVAARHYPPTPTGIPSMPVLSRVSSRRGESGFYAGIRMKPGSGWSVMAGSDLYQLGSARVSEPFAPSGQAHVLALEYRPRSWLKATVQYRTTREATYLSGEPLNQESTLCRQRFRLDVQYEFSPSVSTISRAEAVWYREGSRRSTGLLLLQEASMRLGDRLTLVGRYGAFDTDDFDTRFTTFERDVAYAYSAPSLYGNGTRAYLLLRAMPLPGVTLEGRYARTLCDEEEAFSLVPAQSVLDTFRIQARFAW